MVVRLQEGDRRGGELITVEDRFDTERVMIKAGVIPSVWPNEIKARRRKLTRKCK